MLLSERVVLTIKAAIDINTVQKTYGIYRDGFFLSFSIQNCSKDTDFARGL